MMHSRRSLLIGSAAATGALAMPSIVRGQTRTVKMGSLRLIHSMTPHFYERFAPPGLKIEIITFDSPTDGKNAVVTKSVDFGGFGIAAGTLGAAAGEPVVVVGAFCNKGMGVVAKAGSDIKTIKDAVKEGTRIYSKLRKMNLNIEFLDVGGGLDRTRH